MGLKQVVTAESWMQVVIKGDVKVCVDNLNVIRLNLKKYFSTCKFNWVKRS